MVRLTVALAAAVFAAACSPIAATTSTTTVGSPTSTAGSARPPFCETQWAGRSSGRVTDERLREISGAVMSRAHAGIIWVHNDSGDDPVVYAIAHDGTLQGLVTLPDVAARDWEDMAIGPGPQPGDYLYLADIGDNRGARESVQIHRIAEPSPTDTRADGGDMLTITYPDGPTEAETLLVDPVSGEMLIVGKALSGRTPLFTIPAGTAWSGVVEAGPAGHLTLGTFALATGGDATERLVVIRTYDEVFVWERSGGTLAETITGPGCRLATVADRQGEAIALDPDSDRFFALSEGTGEPLLVFEPLP